MHRIVVDEKKWLSEERFLHALNFCMLLPGPEAQQLATYVGWLMHGVRGALLAGLLFILPGALALLALSVAYVTWQESPPVTALLFGLKSAVLAIVLEAVVRVGRRVLKNGALVVVAAAAFGALFFLGVPFPLVIGVAGSLGALGSFLAPRYFPAVGEAKRTGAFHATLQPAAEREAGLTMAQRELPSPSLGRDLRLTAVCGVLWFGPLVWLRQWLGPDSVFYQEGTFFSFAAVVTFGGAYSVLNYVAQQAVGNYGWLNSREMLDGLGMAETTPGPLIMVVQFVGFLGAYRNPGPFSPLVAGLLGSLVTTWVTFVPCFYWILLGAPRMEQARRCKWLASALTAITAAVVGVILNLAVWFALHTLFGHVSTFAWGPWRVPLPDPTSVDVGATCLAATAVVLVFVARRGMLFTLATCCMLGGTWQLAVRWLA